MDWNVDDLSNWRQSRSIVPGRDRTVQLEFITDRTSIGRSNGQIYIRSDDAFMRTEQETLTIGQKFMDDQTENSYDQPR